MKIFKLQWSWYEDISFTLWSHDTKDYIEFENDIKSVALNHIDDFLKLKHARNFGANDLVGYVASKLPDLGYTELVPETFSFFGCYIINGSEDDIEDDEEFINIFGKEVYQKIMNHNNCEN